MVKTNSSFRQIVAGVCLLACLWIGLSPLQVAFALASMVKGEHQLAIVADGNHADLVFAHSEHHAHEGHTGHHPHSQSMDSIFSKHHGNHHDHVMHLKVASAGQDVLTSTNTSDWESLLKASLDLICHQAPDKFSLEVPDYRLIHVLPQPPPLVLRQLEELRTIVLLL